MFKQIRVLTIVALGLLLFGGSVSALQAQSEKTVRVLVRINDAPIVTYSAPVSTVGRFIESQGVALEEGGVTNFALEDEIESDMLLEITNPVTVYMRINGSFSPVAYRALPALGAKVIADYSLETGREFIYEPKAGHKNIEAGQIIDLTSVETKLTEAYQDVPFETEYRDTAELTVGQERVIQEGKNGRMVKVTKTTFEARKETSREEGAWTTALAPVTRIIEKGTAPIPTPEPPKQSRVVPESELDFAKVLEMNVTAYTADYASTGKRPGDRGFGVCATGMKAQMGVIAVDPRVIPLRTWLYVEGYGYAIAGDTGGAIKGNIIDLFFNTAQEVAEFGRQTRKVYVLTNQDEEYFTVLN